MPAKPEIKFPGYGVKTWAEGLGVVANREELQRVYAELTRDDQSAPLGRAARAAGPAFSLRVSEVALDTALAIPHRPTLPGAPEILSGSQRLAAKQAQLENSRAALRQHDEMDAAARGDEAATDELQAAFDRLAAVAASGPTSANDQAAAFKEVTAYLRGLPLASVAHAAGLYRIRHEGEEIWVDDPEGSATLKRGLIDFWLFGNRCANGIGGNLHTFLLTF